MPKFFLFLLMYLYLLPNCSAQKIIIQGTDPHNLYVNDGDSTLLFYHKIVPKNTPIGVLVLLPGAGERIEEVMQSITLHRLAVESGILVVFPSINFGTNKMIYEHQLLDKILKQVCSEHKIDKNKVILGGFSGGGMVSLTYTEKANREPNATFLKPKAVFGIDPPLDYAHLWNHCVNDIERNVSDVAVNESKWIMAEYTKEFGGSPQKFSKNYIKYSIYSHGVKNGGNAQYLKNTPVRLYTEPDILWQIENRSRDFYDLNCVDISAMINRLRLMGNKNAELIVTHDKGYRPDGRRHPHSWSIMDSQDCLSWVLKQLKE